MKTFLKVICICIVFAIIHPIWTILIIFGIVSLFQCVLPQPDPLDRIGPKMSFTTNICRVRDTLSNQFHVIYCSSNPVTKLRAEEIGNREHVQAAEDSLQEEASRVFPDFTNVDIYDFTKLAMKYSNELDQYIQTVYADGYTFFEMYKNPSGDSTMSSIEDTIVDYFSTRGMPYIEKEEIDDYFMHGKPKRYRYYESIQKYYERDEHITHCYKHFTRE